VQPSEYATFDAVGLAELVRNGDVTAEELTETAITVIEERNPAINAVVDTYFDRARDILKSETLPSGPFTGVPFLLKDLQAEEGMPVTFGSVFFKDFVAPQSDVIGTRMRGAGFSVLGRTASPEFGLLPITESRLHGPTRNPWDLTRSPGGSSGGSAAAVAAGMVPMAHGGDGGGSLRIPASACGLFALKPSRGTMPRQPNSLADRIAVDGCISRTVRDSAAFLDAVGGPTLGDLWRLPLEKGSLTAAVTVTPRPLRIAVRNTDHKGRPVHSACRDMITDVVTLLEDLGHTVVDESPTLNGAAMEDAFLTLWAAFPATAFRTILDQAGSAKRIVRLLRKPLGDYRTMQLLARVVARGSGMPAFEPFTWGLIRRARNLAATDILYAFRALQEVAYTYGDFFDRYDVELSPVLSTPPVRIGAIDQTKPMDELTDQLARYVGFTPIANFAGLPAMSVPLHWTDANLPIGSHFTASHGNDALLIQLAKQLEDARPWNNRRPTSAGASKTRIGR
jgi:amidase